MFWFWLWPNKIRKFFCQQFSRGNKIVLFRWPREAQSRRLVQSKRDWLNSGYFYQSQVIRGNSWHLAKAWEWSICMSWISLIYIRVDDFDLILYSFILRLENSFKLARFCLNYSKIMKSCVKTWVFKMRFFPLNTRWQLLHILSRFLPLSLDPIFLHFHGAFRPPCHHLASLQMIALCVGKVPRNLHGLSHARSISHY